MWNMLCKTLWYDFHMPKKKNKIIQVPMPEDLVEKLDKLSYEMGESRSFVLREAAAKYIRDAQEAEDVRRYIESYTKEPMTQEEKDWIDVGVKYAAQIHADDDWTAEYEAFVKEHDAER